VFVEAPSVIISITSPSSTEFAAVGVSRIYITCCRTCIASVQWLRLLQQLRQSQMIIPALAVAIAPPNTEDILIILPASGQQHIQIQL
jgi:hypothetical protein